MNQPFALTEVVIFDGEKVLEADTVIVRDGLIEQVTSGTPARDDVTVIPGSGGVLLPGLIDAHVHGMGSIAAAARSALRFGTTTMFEMFGQIERRERERRQELDNLTRADVWSSGIGATVPGGHPSADGWDFPTVVPETDINRFVARRLDEGSDYIKLFIDDGSSRQHSIPTLSPDQVQAVVAAAHHHGVLAFAHVGTWHDAKVAVDKGIDALVHAPGDQPTDYQVIDMLAASDTPVVATLAVMSAFGCAHDSRDFLEFDDVAPLLDDTQRRQANNYSFGECNDGPSRAAQANVAALYEAGVPIVAGTDLPLPGTIPGVSLMHELELLGSAGLPDEAVLAASTSAAADMIGLNDRGRITPGLRADLVLMKATAIEDVIGSYAIAAIWKNGHAVDRRPNEASRG